MSSIPPHGEQELGLRDVHVARVDLAETQVLGTRLRGHLDGPRRDGGRFLRRLERPGAEHQEHRLLAREVELELDLAAVASAARDRPIVPGEPNHIRCEAEPQARRDGRAEAQRVDGVAEQHHGRLLLLDQGLQRSVVNVRLEVLGRVLHRQQLVDTGRPALGVPAGALADDGHGDAAAGLVLQPEGGADQLAGDLAQLSLRLSAITRTPLIRSSSP